MKLMKRLLLIHWHYYLHQMIEFDKVNFLTGQNASGKSTIIDALQLILLCDTSGSFFNKAASGRAERTLTGYLRGELGDEEDAGFRYLRSGRFTSYIAVEFYDDVKRSWFTSGCCFDTFGENDCQRLFFRFDGRIPEHEFTKIAEQGARTPLSIEELRGLIRRDYTVGHSYTTSVNRDFREDLCGKLGGIQPKRFCDLLKKAVSFNPNVNIQQFITDFVCGEEERVNISEMLENIQSYDNLKSEAEGLKQRIALLLEISQTYSEYTKNRDSEILYSYLIERAQLEEKIEELSAKRERAAQLKADQTALELQLIHAEQEKHQLQQERDGLKLQLAGNETVRHYEELTRQIDEKRVACMALQNSFEQSAALLQRALVLWKQGIMAFESCMNAADLSLIEPMLRARVAAIRSNGEKLLQDVQALNPADAEAVSVYGLPRMQALFRAVEDYRSQSKSMLDRLREAQKAAADQIAALKREKALLEKGRYQFPPDALDLKEAVESRLQVKYGSNATAFIVAEAAEIANDRWRNVIEGYLGNQKYYVVVAPEHFYTAFQLFGAVKREKPVYNTGLVDTLKLERMNPKSDEGSLAEELQTENTAVRLYLNFVLGRVKKCDTIEELRWHRTAVTDKGILYRNLVVREMNPKSWASPAIGRAGARIRLETIMRELAVLEKTLLAYASLANVLQGADQMVLLSGADAAQIIKAAEAIAGIPALEETIRRLEADREMIDRSEIEVLQKRLDQRQEALNQIESALRDMERKKGKLENEVEQLEEATIPDLEVAVSELQHAFLIAYSDEFVADIGNPRYERELLSRGHAEEISRAFPREQSRSRNTKDEMWDQLKGLRGKYNSEFKMGYYTSAVDNDAYHKLLVEYQENKLPDYEAKIEDARSKAFAQFKEDFLSRLQSNIFNARSQIDILNKAMRGARFGEDTFRFRVVANPQYKRYHDMIVDKMTLEGGYNLFSEQYETKYREEMTELFSLITNGSSISGAVASEDYEKRVKTFTDYKTYLSFDLESIKPNGDTERLSKTMGKKSGGETQTPFYIAVLASFVQLYRVGGSGKEANTARLILFDEAFSKMDGERIVQSIALLKEYEFQVVLSAPPDKIHDIVTQVDRNLCAIRDGRKVAVLTFDAKKMKEYADELGV